MNFYKFRISKCAACALCLIFTAGGVLAQERAKDDSLFDSLDSASTTTVKMLTQAAQERAQWNAGKAEILARIATINSTNANLKARITAINNERAKALQEVETITEKVEKAEKDLNDFSSYLDGKYQYIINNNKASEALKNGGFDLKTDFKSKTVAEKFRCLCFVMQILKAQDCKISNDNQKLSTGAFVRARQISQIQNGVVILKVGEQKEIK